MKKLFILGFLIVAFGFGFYAGGDYINKEAAVFNGQGTFTLVINQEQGFARVFPEVVYEDGENLFTALSRFFEENRIEFAYKDYGGDLGVFITSIASSTGANNKWWQYWVNGQYANIGVSNYAPRGRDVIEFRLTEEQN